ncbi:hypothetical protein FY036_18205 [Mesorhizobium microcysteis]|uniref:Uncharacterized protein n=1 Tax=Neoaquamicrobium microcysteis TaxID=2682781 RepID=A0A5D4GRS2_9HYPH|nr:hypothetical protein [Mesorhizobium microcysteis]TYR30643.1 hypothetical protein FY036_18205 [Mesorhizobium microcysteis]
MLRFWREPMAALRAYTAHPDPLVASANFLALLVASNQPFYPLYLYWIVSETVWPAYYTFLSTPFFLAVPALARRNTMAGRALLPLTGIGNGIMCAQLFGVQSGVEIFLIPCAVLALLLFRPHERWLGYLLAGMAFAAYLVLGDWYGSPAVVYTAEEYAAFIRLNAVSAAALTVCAALVFSNVLAQTEKSAAELARRREPG